MREMKKRFAELQEPVKRSEEIPLGQAAQAIEIPDTFEPSHGATEHMYMPTESLFGGVGNAVRARGWTILPQEREGNRLPSRIDGVTIQWSQYIDSMPTPEETRRWGIQARTANGALLLGPASGNVWALDIDVLDEDLSIDIQDLAKKLLGVTKFRRQGMAPKMALFYRAETDDERPAYRSFKFVDADGRNTSGDGIEILGRGRLMTAYGYHHKTSEYFRWTGPQPITHEPDEVPVATKAQLEAFIDAVQDLRAFHRNANRTIEGTWTAADSDGVRVPKLRYDDQHDAWTENDSGIVVDGRENFMWSLSRQAVRHNGALAETEDGVAKIRQTVLEEFQAKAAMTGRWTVSYLKTEILDKVSRAVAMLRQGTMQPAQTVAKANAAGVVVPNFDHAEFKRVAPKSHDVVEGFEFLPKKRSHIPIIETAPNPVKAAQRALDPDRAAVGAKATAEVAAAVNAFFDDVENDVARIHIVDGATGVGKTATTIKEFVKRPSFLQIDQGVTDEDGNVVKKGPMIFLVPTYQNVDELRAKSAMTGLDPNMSDDALILAATDLGLIPEDNVERHVAELRRFAAAAELEAMTYKGKIRAGCLEAEKVSALQAANMPTGQLCKARVRVRDEYGMPTSEFEEVHCPHYSTCPAIKQREEMAKSHLVFMVRSFLTLHIPDEAANPRGVVLDERIFDQLIKTTTFPISSLLAPRRAPTLTKEERKVNAQLIEDGKFGTLDPLELLQAREQASDLAIVWMKDGKDLAAEFHAWSEKTGNGKAVKGAELVATARRVCGSAMTSQAEISPELSLQEVRDIAAKPSGVDVAKEYRFWALIDESIEKIVAAELSAGKMATPAQDNRIHLLDYDATDDQCRPSVQISWKVDGNWTGAPMLLLDASTDENLVKLALGDHREIVVHKIDVNLNQRVAVAIDRRLSSTTLYPKKDAPPNEWVRAATTLADIRLQIATVAATHAHGCVFVSMPKRMRRIVLKGWMRPFNADFGHIGANAGLDYARGHVAVLEIGRMELPVREIDGLTAALIHGDAQALEPRIDYLGTKKHADGNDIMPHKAQRLLRRRDGADIYIRVQEHQGKIARAVQRQYREENTIQDIGRGRAVYREDPLSVFIVSESVPAYDVTPNPEKPEETVSMSIVVDEVIGFEDLATKSGGRFWDAVRLAGGVVEPAVLAHFAPHLGDVATFEKLIKQWMTLPSIDRKYHKIIVTRDNGANHDLYVPSWSPHWTDYLKAVLNGVGWKGSLRVIERGSCATYAADPAPVDEIETYLHLSDQRQAEIDLMQVFIDRASDRGCWRRVPFGSRIPGATTSIVPSDYKIGEGAYAEFSLRMDVWLMLDQQRDAWALTGSEVLTAPGPEVVSDDDIAA